MKESGLEPEFYKEIPNTSVMAFLRNRLAKTHDTIHTLCNFKTSVSGELGVQAFMAGQLPPLVPTAIIISELIHVVFQKDQFLA